MKKLFLMLTLAAFVMAASCSKDINWDDDKTGGGKKPTTNCEAIMADEGPFDNITTSSGTKVVKAWMEGDNLKLEIGYSGCDKHTFDMHWDKNQVNPAIYPSQTTLQLVDNNGEQMCQAYFTDTLCFNVSQLKTGKHGAVNIKLQGFDDVNVMYEY